MLLDKTINSLFIGTRYLVWGMAILGIFASLALFVVNIPLGFLSATVFIATFALAIALSLLLAPQMLVNSWLTITSRLTIGLPSLLVALAVMGMIYYANGGFPALNLLF